MFNSLPNRSERSYLKSVFKQYPLESILWGLWQFKDELNSIEIAYTTTIAIEFSKPGQYCHIIKPLDKSILLKLVNLATNFCLNNGESGEKFSRETNDIFYKIFNLMANQLSVSYRSHGDYSRALLLYEIIPNEIENNKFEHSLSEEFIKDKGYSINEYLQVCFLTLAAIHGSGKFADDYLEKALTVTQSPSFETMNKILFDISASAVHYRRERKRLNTLDSFKYQPILMYPLIKPWSHIPMNTKGKRYLSPLPNLIAHKAHMGIYHHFLSKYKTKFTRFFGKEIFERYVCRALECCCHKDEIKDEDTIKTDYKIPEGVKIPDFLFIKDNRGIIVECKAAILPLGVYTKGSMIDFKTTVNKIYKGVCQTASFEQHALNNSLYNVKEWICLIITYEPLWGVNSGILSEILITDFKDEDEALKFRDGFDKVLILSVSQLDIIQTHTSETNSLYSILKKIKSGDFNDVINNLVDKTGRTFKDSYLAEYTEQITNSLVPETNVRKQAKLL
ncbi:hypothetical protein EPICR_60118 [Candidatus Desulfarcum epimagneticum]|uniref:Uncharacterized protein n=1 Tax=uncultured Desulfobacteraceae bacterium TaxID=218296 RepID=A0A484HLN2_9BACT|nr:hypothetical protein EPICR_60118 [uncultured Desulfobacteraceae bacterium]